MNTYIIILAGGIGRRLWPVSQRALPKQFIDIFGVGETMLQSAACRASRIVGKENVLVVTSEEYVGIAKQQLPWITDSHILAEPIHRNTCPAAAWAVHRVMMESGSNDSVVALMAADQLIMHEDRFAAALSIGADYVTHNDTALTMGVTPTRVEPGYGYIQLDSQAKICQVKSFIEKPEREFAKMLIESGEFLWNTGIYLGRVGFLRRQFEKILPHVMRDIRIAAPEEENEFVRKNYSKYPNISLDMAILEKIPNRSVMHCDFGWADIGTWHGIYEAMNKDGEDNVVVNRQSRVIADDSHHNIVSLRDGRLAILSGMEGYIVAESKDTLLICPKGDSSALVRKFLTMVENE